MNKLVEDLDQLTDFIKKEKKNDAVHLGIVPGGSTSYPELRAFMSRMVLGSDKVKNRISDLLAVREYKKAFKVIEKEKNTVLK